MKTRNGFVSNSSSSSFIIPLDMLTECKITSIFNHIEEAKKYQGYYDFGGVDFDDAWMITQDEYYIEGYTNMDNFSMSTFLEDYLKIPDNVIKWDFN